MSRISRLYIHMTWILWDFEVHVSAHRETHAGTPCEHKRRGSSAVCNWKLQLQYSRTWVVANEHDESGSVLVAAKSTRGTEKVPEKDRLTADP